jgi:flagellar biosynthesis protein
MYSRRLRFKREQLFQDGKNALGDSGDPGKTQAVALGYDPEHDAAPRVLASGRGAVAEQIISLARKHQIPIHDDPLLTAALANVNVDQLIPPELYAVVAEVLAYIYRITQK